MGDENEKRLGMIWNWAHQYGAALKPPGPDTYSEGMRDAKDQVKRLLSDALPLADEQALAAMRAQRDEARELVRAILEADLIDLALARVRARHTRRDDLLRVLEGWDEEAERW